MFLRCCITFSILLILFTPGAPAQRIFATVDASETDESLRFDVNNIPVDINVREHTTSGFSGGLVDLNYSPNIVFSPDSRKAFVSFSGADKVMVFDPYSGDILKLIEIEANPTQIAISPDGRTLAVIALHLNENLPSPQEDSSFISTLAVIDIETLDTKSVRIENALMSFANNPVFSPDSRFVFIPSMITSELIRVDAETMEEAGSRLAFTPGSRPATITVAPDGNSAAVVLIGSPGLSRIENPDSVALIDLINFQLIETIAPVTGADSAPDDNSRDHLLHDFVATNTFTYTDDGRFGIISDVAFSSFSSAPELSFDRAWIYDFERKEFFQPVAYPGVATGSFYSPKTREFAILGTFTVTFLNPYKIREAVDNGEEIPQRGITPTRSHFRPRTKAVFDHFNPIMYLTAPVQDTLLVVNLITDEINGIDVGTPVERKQVTTGPDDEKIETDVIYPAAPLDVALSPNNEVLAVLNFNANTIDLLIETDSYYLPGTHQDPNFFVGLAVSNPGSEPVRSLMTGYSLNGLILGDNPDTEGVVEYVNPAEINLPSKGQFAQTVEEILQFKRDPSSTPIEGSEGEEEENELNPNDEIVNGWIHMESPRPDPRSLFFYGDYDLQRLGGGLGKDRTYQKAVFPYFRDEDGWATELYVVNPNLSSTKIEIALFDHQGKLIEIVDRTLPARFLFKSFVKDPDPAAFIVTGIFKESVFEPCGDGSSGNEDEDENYDEEDTDIARHCGFTEGYFIVLVPPKDTSDEGNLLPDGGFVAWQRVYNEEKLAVTDAIPVPWDTEFESDPVVLYLPIVLSGTSSTAHVNLANPTGMAMKLKLSLFRDGSAPISTELELKSAHSVRKNLADFFDELDVADPVSGWLMLESDTEGISATVDLEFPKSMTSISFQDRPSNRLIFSHQASSGGLSTGLAILNPTLETAQVTMELYSAAGELIDTAQFSLEPRSRVSRLVNEFFSGPVPDVGGYIEVHSDQPLAGIETLFTNDLGALAAIQAQ